MTPNQVRREIFYLITECVDGDGRRLVNDVETADTLSRHLVFALEKQNLL
jgi:hypothetical protein